jgi:methylamine---glutamate N-methyltransferase subunit A
MCGIVGLYLKNPKLKPKLGKMFKPMLIEMTNRGPDSAGVAIYRNPTKKSETKFSLAHDDTNYNWKALVSGLNKALKTKSTMSKIGNHCIVVTSAKEPDAVAWLKSNHPQVRVVPAIRLKFSKKPDFLQMSMTSSTWTTPQAPTSLATPAWQLKVL